MCRYYRIRHSEFLTWSDDDRAKAIWSHVRAMTACPSCGTRPEEWDPAAGGDRAAYVAEARTCPGCVARKHREDALPPQQRDGTVHVHLRRREVTGHAEP